MFFHTLFRVQTYLYTSVPVAFFPFFFFFSNFVVCKFCRLFSIFWSFFSRIHTIEKKIPISSKTICSHSAKIHQEKSLLCTEFLLFFHSGFICYDRPCNFSFSPQAAPIIATGQGEPALHWYTHLLEQGLLEAVFVDSETLILSTSISTPKL